ncbi:MAG TPA: YihY/virulence factor BrkB family protein [Acidobacteriaceae bacterium]|nr:YihY/virulence factor BrkB family protein [Acidobacteriaceae bacterium]
MLPITPRDRSNDTIALTPEEFEEQSHPDEPQVLALLRYLTRTAVHTYAFSVAANAILSLFPFIVLMLTIAHRFMHSRQMVDVIANMLRALLPTGQDFVVRNMVYLVYSQKQVALVSVFMLLVSSTGVFLPLEVALNQVWGVRVNRPYWRNQLISLGLAFMVGILALVSVAVSVSHETLLRMLFFGHTESPAFHFLQKTMLQILGGVASILIFFLIYWILPNRRIRVLSVLPAAIVTGLFWEAAKLVYIAFLPLLDLHSVYGPFSISVGLMLWAFVSGLILLAGAHFSATYHLRNTALRERSRAEKKTFPPQA